MSLESLKIKIIEKAWKDPAFKAKLQADPKGALQEAFGITIPEGIELRVEAETPSSYVLVIPPNPEELDSVEGESGNLKYNWA